MHYTDTNTDTTDTTFMDLPFIGRGWHQISQQMDVQKRNCVMKEKRQGNGLEMVWRGGREGFTAK